MVKLSIEELFDDHAKNLELIWLVGQNKNQRALILKPELTNVSYLSLIHPPQIQLIGTHELAYLNSLSKDFYKNTILNYLKIVI
jgi:serine kinase of HPr protein (carbohydrate metabolism regulator)